MNIIRKKTQSHTADHETKEEPLNTRRTIKVKQTIFQPVKMIANIKVDEGRDLAYSIAVSTRLTLFRTFLSSAFFFKINFFEKSFHEYHKTVKQFGSRSCPTFWRVW